MLLFNAVVSLSIACIVNALPSISSLFNCYTVMEGPYIFSLIYAHSKLDPNKCTLISGYIIPSAKLPSYLMFFHLLTWVFTDYSPFNDLIGMATGYIYYYLID